MSSSLHVVCSHCDAVIRVPRERLADAPRCARCHQPVFTGGSIPLTTARFDAHVNRTDVPVIVDVWAPWCGPCRAMAPAFEAVARQYEPRARFVKVNSDEEPALSQRFGIRGIPTLIAFRGGREVARQTGALDTTSLARWVSSLL